MIDEEAAYQKTLDYLYSFVDYSLQRQFQFSPDKFNLQRMQAFAAALGNPQKEYPIIHVAGTKGKGSVTSLCASALKAAGYRVGQYISPHLNDYNERIQVDGQPISHAELVALVEEIKPVIAAIPELTTFEITTALGFLYFRKQKVDAAVIEVGLGGRLDATNIVIPRVSVITSLSYDHTNLLGNTLAEIATEKAGIIKEGVPVVLSPQKEEARLAVAKVADARHSRLLQTGEDYRYTPLEHSLDGQSLLVWSKDQQAQMDACIEGACPQGWQPARLDLPLLGYHQIENAVTAYAALQVFCQSGIQLGEEAIQQGFKQVSWPGRFEILQRDGPPLVIDSAHNRDSALKLRITLDDYFPDFKVIWIFGASEDKDLTGMVAELLPHVRLVIATQAVHPRAAETGRLIALAHQFGKPALAVTPVGHALREAFRQAGEHDLVLSAGSIFLAAEVREAWLAMQESVHGVVDER